MNKEKKKAIRRMKETIDDFTFYTAGIIAAIVTFIFFYCLKKLGVM
jgi:hypothetical protein